MSPSAIFYDSSKRLYGNRARAGLFILSKKIPLHEVRFLLLILFRRHFVKAEHGAPILSLIGQYISV